MIHAGTHSGILHTRIATVIWCIFFFFGDIFQIWKKSIDKMLRAMDINLARQRIAVWRLLSLFLQILAVTKPFEAQSVAIWPWLHKAPSNWKLLDIVGLYALHRVWIRTNGHFEYFVECWSSIDGFEPENVLTYRRKHRGKFGDE